ncbi:MAG: PASTA domain-containing protein [Clostridia bacterium]|nr:PASTA domain-containing protein [Clostridia bacterium]
MNDKVKRTTHLRITAILLIFSLLAAYLLFNIFQLSYLKYDYYREKTYDQVTTSSALKAERGIIYDSNMNTLAKSNTVWRIFVSTRDIKAAEKSSGKDYCKIIADGLAPILSLNSTSLYEKLRSSSVLDVTIKKDASEDEYKKTIDFIREGSLESLVFTEAESSRYYPGGTLAAHVLGFTGADNQGLYGLEYYYDDILSGTDGYYVYAKDAGGRALDTEYSDYFPAEDGYSIVTTIDSYVQSELEAVIEMARVNHGAQNRVCGIVMNTKTGAIIAMATTTPFDPNDPFALDEESQKKLNNSGLIVGTDEYKAYKNELMQIMWSNKAVSETYEPGSTFKIVTVSAALDLGVASINSKFSCSGYKQVGGWRIKCHKTTGHGSGFNLAYGLQMSCNPCMMTLAEGIGAGSFYDYVERFGYFEKSGIDLPSEASTIFHKEEGIGTTELATASFGQRFKVSIINHLTAISAVANGGRLIAPYLVEKIIDSKGRVVSEHQTEIKRQVVSAEVAGTVSKILIDGVSGDGGAKNAGVAGYDIAAKTGTSQKFDILDENGNSYLRIGSTVAYSINEDEGISMIIVVDEPTSNVKYGSVVAAPYISMLMEKLLPYFEYRSNSDIVNTTVENYVGMNINTVVDKLKKLKLEYEIVGDGDTVIRQTPNGNDTLTIALSKIILYTSDIEDDNVSVPSLVGLTTVEAIRVAVGAGLNVRLAGASASSPDAMDIIIEQSLPQGERVKRGSIITIRAINNSFED